jgi:hypothetical protein
MFYFAQITVPTSAAGPPLSFLAGAGDPPITPEMQVAVGGVGPLIISGIGFGTTNPFAPGAPGTPPATGAPPAADVPFLRQRSNASFDSIERRPATTGKTILAWCWSQRKLIVIVQPHGNVGTTYTDIRNKLAALWIDHAVFLDGSRFAATPATCKNDLDTIAIGFT